MKLNKTKKEIIFLICILAVPLTKFVIFYIGVNINSILLAFQKYTIDGKTVFAGFDNFRDVFATFSDVGELRYGLKNSLLLYAVGLIISLPLGLFFSFYIYKKCFMSSFFKIVLFLPSIISGLVSVLIFQYFVEDGIGNLIGSNLLTDPSTSFGTVVFFNLWCGFGTAIIMYSNAMSRIDPSVVEYGKLEGVTPMREFVSITLPMIFPTITSMLVMGVAAIFTNQAGLFAFFAEEAEAYNQTIGYYIFIKVIRDANMTEYPFCAAAGLIFTLICVPLTISLRWALEKFGPSEE